MGHELLLCGRCERGERICRCWGGWKSEERYPSSDASTGGMSLCCLLNWMNLLQTSYTESIEKEHSIGEAFQKFSVENANIFQSLSMTPAKQTAFLKYLPMPTPCQALGVWPWGQEVKLWHNFQKFPLPLLPSKQDPCKHFCKLQNVHGP